MINDKNQDTREPGGGIILGSPLPHDPDAPEHVGPTFAGPYPMDGGEAGVNDSGSEPIDVRITRYEAEVLLRHWFERHWDVYEFCITYGVTGSVECRELNYSRSRLHVLEPHVTAGLLDELGGEARRRNAAMKAASEEYLRELAAGEDDGELSEL